MTVGGHPLFDLSGRVAVVTGGSSGLGRGMALALAEAGADVVLVDHRKRTEAAPGMPGLGRRTISLVADLADTAAIAGLVETTLREFGGIDILVNNAGIIRRKPALEFAEHDWDEVMAVNARTVFFLSQAVARVMVPRHRGKIIHTASLLSFQGGVVVPSYAASKGAVAQMTKAMANEWAPLGINVNAIAPGYMATNNTRALQDDPELSAQILSRIPAGRWGTPDDLKGAAVFLASSASDYMHGQVLVVDGGWMAR